SEFITSVLFRLLWLTWRDGSGSPLLNILPSPCSLGRFPSWVLLTPRHFAALHESGHGESRPFRTGRRNDPKVSRTGHPRPWPGTGDSDTKADAACCSVIATAPRFEQ